MNLAHQITTHHKLDFIFTFMDPRLREDDKKKLLFISLNFTQKVHNVV